MEPSHTCPSLPASAVPVDVIVYAHTWKVHSHYVQWDLPASSPSPSDIQDLVPTLAEWEQPLLEGLTLQVSIAELLEELQSPIRVASDGSVNDHRSSFAWVLANREGRRLLKAEALLQEPNPPPTVLKALASSQSSDAYSTSRDSIMSLSKASTFVTTKT